MPRAGLSATVVVNAAMVVADEIGLAKLTLAELAARLGVRLPSLYKHVDGLPGLHQALAVAAKRELIQVISQATVGRSRGAALTALAAAMRDWARDHPGRYEASTRSPTDDPEDQQVSAAAVRVIFDILGGYGLDEATAIDATRTLRAGLDGFVRLERNSGFGMDRSVDASVAFFLAGLDQALSNQPGQKSAR